jgi:acetylornithine deacetylase/succinyl-diaminopimelate desuccinylase
MSAGNVLSRTDMEDSVKLAQDLIRIPGHRELAEKETKVAEFITHWFEKAGIDVKTRDVTPGRPNVIAAIRGSGDGVDLMFNCHMDTVPAYGWAGRRGPFEAEIREGRIYGRGSCDVKGAIASVMVAMRRIQRHEKQLKGDLIFAGVVGEEGDSSIGTKEILQEGPKPHAAIVCEPTDLCVSIGQRGSSNLLISTYGRAAHSAFPERGANAIIMMSDVLQMLKKELFPRLKQRKHKLMGSPTLTPAVIQGGTRTDVVPDVCRSQLNYRYYSGEEPAKIEKEISEFLRRFREKNPDFKADIKIVSDSLGMETSRNHMIVKAVKQAARKLTGKNPRIIGSRFWTDASILANLGGVPSVIFGPGKEEMAHTPIEYVEVNQLHRAAQIYAAIASEICSSKTLWRGSSGLNHHSLS